MEKDLNPFEFTLEINGEPQAIRIEHPKTKDYIVYINGERSGHIYPVASGNRIDWKSEDGMDQTLLDEIGKHIEIMEDKTK
ncbi:MAG: hypothetical protein WC623_11595 [Pedobacter sp.]|uniref:hypothetical protein n=1 Tax=Pedobacter sp. TaxID=1411316 RepID=UPI00356B4EDE